MHPAAWTPVSLQIFHVPSSAPNPPRPLFPAPQIAAIEVILWFSAFFSAVLDNIP